MRLINENAYTHEHILTGVNEPLKFSSEFEVRTLSIHETFPTRTICNIWYIPSDKSIALTLAKNQKKMD